MTLTTEPKTTTSTPIEMILIPWCSICKWMHIWSASPLLNRTYKNNILSYWVNAPNFWKVNLSISHGVLNHPTHLIYHSYLIEPITSSSILNIGDTYLFWSIKERQTSTLCTKATWPMQNILTNLTTCWACNIHSRFRSTNNLFMI